jgi:hypothetical protein
MKGIKHTRKFCNELQSIMSNTGKADYTINAEDLNARIGKVPIPELLGTNGEEFRNINGKYLTPLVV